MRKSTVFSNDSFVDHLEFLDVDDAIDAVIEHFEAWFFANNWCVCEQVLAKAAAKSLAPAVALAILSITLVEKARLSKFRQNFFNVTRERLVADYGEEEAEDNLRGLK